MTVAPAPSDATLVARLRSRDRTAWEDVYRLYGDRLYRFAYRLTGNPHDASDLVQETFVRALPRLDSLDPEGLNLGAYLLTTEKNLFLKSVERTRRQEPVEVVPEPSTPAPIEDDPERSTLLGGQQEEVRKANAALAPRQRLVLALRELEDRSYAEIGELVGLNENAVAQLISRARQSLRQELRLVQVERSKLPAECQSFLPLLSAHLDGQLEGAQLERTLAHLEACEVCQAALADMREASRLYRTLIPLPFPELFGRIEDALAASGFWSGTRSLLSRAVPRSRRARAGAAAILGGALLASLSAVAFLGGGDPAVVAETTTGTPETVVEVVTDSQPPRLLVPAAGVTAEATGPDGAEVAFTVRARDRVDGVIEATCAPSSGDAFALGTTTVECTAEDEAGNGADASFQVNVSDTTAPDLSVPEPIELEAGSEIEYEAAANDLVDGPLAPECSVEPGTVLAAGATEVVCTVEDASGNAASRSFAVTVGEAEAPALTLPEARTVEATGRDGARVTFSASARGDGQAVATRCSRRSGSVFRLGTSTVRCTATSGDGARASGSFVVRVVDTTPPTLRLPPTRRVEAQGPGGSAVAFTVTARDLVDGAVAARCSPRSRARFHLGTTTVRCTAADRRRNRSTGTFAIVVRDTRAPTLRLPGSLTTEATGPTGAPVSFTATATDGVSGTVQPTCAPASGATFPLGETTVRCSARDARGNQASGSFRVAVVDTTAPTLTLPPNRTVQATSSSGAVVTFGASARDLVDGAVAPSCSPASGSTFPVGTTTVTCTARDARGNGASGSFTVTVTPLPRPDLVVSVTPTSFTVRNVGNAPAGAFTATVQGVGTFTFAGLAPGASATRTVSCASIQRTVTVDPANAVAESNEANNTARIPPC
jgi:RNA polymerase sigma factor (sigma-70 family)